jgi:hypothetical protein
MPSWVTSTCLLVVLPMYFLMNSSNFSAGLMGHHFHTHTHTRNTTHARYNDITYVKLLKLNILQLLANEKNFPEIIAELSEYVADVDSEISRKSIKGIGSIALRIVTAADEAIENLLGFLNLNMVSSLNPCSAVVFGVDECSAESSRLTRSFAFACGNGW